MPLEKDLEAGKAWVFDESVTDNFDEMLKRSVPQHDEMRATVVELATRFAQPLSYVVDVGCSRGEALATVRAALDGRSIEYVGIEVSPPMLAAARERFAGCEDVTIVEHDLRNGMPKMPQAWGRRDASVVLSVLTLQFTPIEYRQAIVASMHDALMPGGALVLVEKVLGATSNINRVLVDAYHARKRAAGYSLDEIDRKRHALEGVLVPVTSHWNEDLLRGAGFADVDCVWRSLNFAAWVAIARR